MKNKAPKPAFAVRLVGGAVRPWSVPTSVLARTMNALQRIVASEMITEGEGLPPSLHLISIRQGSAVYKISADEPIGTMRKLSEFAEFLINPLGYQGDSIPVRSVEELSTVARLLNCKIQIHRGDIDSNDILATISGDTYKNMAVQLFYDGQTTIYGDLQRVGGVTDLRCAVRLPTQSKLLYCDVSNQETARQLGTWLYKTVALKGIATWSRLDNRMIDFVILNVSEPRREGIKEAFREAYKAGLSAWDSVDDIEGYLNNVTGGRR